MTKHTASRLGFDAEIYLANRKAAEARLIDAGVYNPEMEHDGCWLHCSR